MDELARKAGEAAETLAKLEVLMDASELDLVSGKQGQWIFSKLREAILHPLQVAYLCKGDGHAE